MKAVAAVVSPAVWRRRLPAAVSRLALQRWAREPLLHFALLGALVFGADHLFAARDGDPRTIVVGADVDAQARRVFKAESGREPDAGQLYALRRVWLDNEVLYREGLALQLDKGDDAIRERVIFKALSMVDADVKLPPHDDALLRRWFDSHRAKYDEPARVDFEEAVLEGGESGAAGEAAVRGFVAALNAGTPGDARAGLRVFKGRPLPSVEQAWGAAFARALVAAAPGRWEAVASADGWRAVRLNAATPARAAGFEALRGVVLQDWTDATLAEQRSAAVAALATKYKVKVEGRQP